MRISSAICALIAFLATAADAATLRVCSDPNNLPFSNRAGQGFENKIAALLARDMNETVTYTWAAQHDTFIKRTLKAGKCDVVMGVPMGMDDIALTAPYYKSTYVFVSRTRDALDISSLSDPRLRTLKIGVHLLGDDPAPPEAALGQENIVDNVTGFMIYGDYAKPNPPARLIEAVANGTVDVAVVWGPLGGYFAKHTPVPLSVSPVTDTAKFAPLVFQYAIAMGVREEDTALRRKLDALLLHEHGAIARILHDYGIPLVRVQGGTDG
jgi:quinoprotein dehydrogenase-associated probable ABC transporter substrate-binding protein